MACCQWLLEPEATGKPLNAHLKLLTCENILILLVTASDVENYKPHPETFLKCAELMNIEPEFIEVFEDGDLGIEAALKPVWLPLMSGSWYDSRW